MGDTARQRIPKSDTNYGVVTNSTIRTASQIGNATGGADFDAGDSTPQTLRVILANGSSVGFTAVSAGVYVYAESTVVVAGSSVVLLTYVPSTLHFLLRVNASGDSDAEFTVKVNGAPVSKKRTNWTERNVDFDFGSNGVPLQSGQTIEILVKNLGKTTSSFNGTIYGEEV